MFAPFPPTKQYTNKKFYLIQDTLALPGRLLVQSKQGSNGSAELRPGQNPFGWDYVDFQLKKNREEQDVIRIIKQLKSSGFSLQEISAELNIQLVPTKNNGI